MEILAHILTINEKGYPPKTAGPKKKISNQGWFVPKCNIKKSIDDLLYYTVHHIPYKIPYLSKYDIELVVLHRKLYKYLEFIFWYVWRNPQVFSTWFERHLALIKLLYLQLRPWSTWCEYGALLILIKGLGKKYLCRLSTTLLFFEIN